MKFRVYKEKEANEEPVVALRLIVCFDGSAGLFAVDSNGNILLDGGLITLALDGTACRSQGVNPDLGFQLDHKGRIRLAGED